MPRRPRPARWSLPGARLPRIPALPWFALPRVRAPRAPVPTRSRAPRLPAVRVPVLPARPRLPAVTAPGGRRAPRTGRWIRSLRSGRSYDVYLPAGVPRRRRIPMVLLLHGCTQTPSGFADSTRFTTVADRNGFALVVPRQERWHQAQRCWRWYESAHQRRGGGEPALLATIVREVCAEPRRWNVDPSRVYVAGISAGGAMALILAATYPDVFAAAGVHSAPPYRSARGGGGALTAMAGHGRVPDVEGSIAPVVVVQGASDHVVRPVNGDRVVEQWLDHRTVGPGHTRTDTGRTAGRRYTRRRWYSGSRRVLEYWKVDGLGHAWSGGRPDASFSDPAGPRASTIMWQFFRAHRTAAQ
jgi:poly(hydroxyalkanoate) depolymerase family esterase